FCEAVHGVGGKHAGTGAAGWAGRALILLSHLVADTGVSGNHHGVDQVQLVLGQFCLACLHRPARDKHHGNIEAHGGHQHAGSDLVAVGDTHQRIGAVGVDHVFHRVGDDIPGRQGIEHAVMTHGDSVIHSDGVELAAHASCFGNFPCHKLAHILEVN